MSCERNSTRVGVAGAAAGVPRLSSRFSNAIGNALAAQVGNLLLAHDKVVGKVAAPVSNKIQGLVDRPTATVARIAPYVVPAVAMAVSIHTAQVRIKQPDMSGNPEAESVIDPNMPAIEVTIGPRPLIQALGNVGTMAGVFLKRNQLALLAQVPKASKFVGQTIASQTRTGDIRRVTGRDKKGMTKVAVDFYASSLTPAFNSLDHMLGREIVSNDGEIVQTGKIAWHRGTSVIKMPGGERTITHLQSLSLPGTHYYFDRALTDEEVVEVVTGQTGRSPHALPGYVGQVSENEGLAPAWACSKHALIKTRLYWPPEQNISYSTETVKDSPVRTWKRQVERPTRVAAV